MDRDAITRGSLFALLAAVAFGVTIPALDYFGKGAGALPIAGLLYAGAASASLVGARKDPPVERAHLPRLALVALFGAAIAPTLLSWGVLRTNAASASLLLNFEAVFTVLLAWRLQGEPLGRRVIVAVIAMVTGGICLVAKPAGGAWGVGALAVVGATLAWALDNTLTRPLADLEPTSVVRWKSVLGCSGTLALALLLGQPFPRAIGIVGLLACGATGYGLSLRLYLLAQRRIGAARTGSIFALAPFIGAAIAARAFDRQTLLSAAFFALGIYLHLTEKPPARKIATAT